MIVYALWGDGRPVRLLFTHGICLILGLFFSTAHASSLIIRHITIEGHTRTQTRVIERELLFASGEDLDTLKIAETERNLRRLYFLGNSQIIVHPDSTWVDITIRVQDLYARALSPLLSGNKDELSYGLTALDYNFLGRGQTVQLTGFHDAVTGHSARFFYRNSRLYASRHTLISEVEIADEGHLLYFSIAHPFYALSTPYSYGLTVYDQRQMDRRYSRGILTARYEDRISGGRVSLIRSFGDRTKIRPGIQLSVSDRRFAPEPGYAYAPPNRRRVLPSVFVTVWQPQYEKQTFVRELGRIEDLQLGSWVTTSAGVSSTAFGSDKNFLFYRLQLVPRYQHNHTFLFSEFSFDGRYQNGTYADVLTHAEFSLFTRIQTIHVLALRVRFDALARPEDADQLLLGLTDGLRGYVPRRFDGTRRYTLNFEVRPTLYRQSRFILGAVAFLDAGDAWTPAQSRPAFHAATGFGLRWAFTQVYDQPILRTDLAYAFRDRAWQLSFGLGHYF